jgi:phosphatidylserine/phosphatidylglycerophosphate/cardiolipin synthase-like enzyme
MQLTTLDTGLELVGRSCTLVPYARLKQIPRFELADQLVAYASPDSTYAVTKRIFDAARRSILIGIYDFTAVYMRDLLLRAMARGVKASLMLDIDSPEEQKLFDNLAGKGCRAVPAPSCASKKVHYFRSSHEKVIVVDKIWTLVQSGNYSKNSVPKNEKDGGNGAFITGNRDMGIAVKSSDMARFFASLLESDMRLELSAEALEAVEAAIPLVSSKVLVEKPANLPIQHFPSLALKPSSAIRALPILTPDNYVPEVLRLLGTAKRSIWIENQYIKVGQSEIRKLLDKIATVRRANPSLDVRIVLAYGMDGGIAVTEAFKQLRKSYALEPGKHLRLLNPGRFTHCHNKLIIVDGRTVLISSQNWSNAAVSENREAGLLLTSKELARYYGAIFESDWSSGLKAVPRRRMKPEEAVVPVIEADRGDYVEV